MTVSSLLFFILSNRSINNVNKLTFMQFNKGNFRILHTMKAIISLNKNWFFFYFHNNLIIYSNLYRELIFWRCRKQYKVQYICTLSMSNVKCMLQVSTFFNAEKIEKIFVAQCRMKKVCEFKACDVQSINFCMSQHMHIFFVLFDAYRSPEWQMLQSFHIKSKLFENREQVALNSSNFNFLANASLHSCIVFEF